MRRWTPFVLPAVLPGVLPVVLATALGLALATPALAQWKWRDKTGQTQYSDLPPPAGTADQDILLRPNAGPQRAAAAAPVAASGASAAASAATRLMPKASEPELEAKRRKVVEEEAARKKADDARLAAARADNCSRAKAQLRTLDSGVRVTRTNEKGEREYLDDAARAAETERARRITAADCK